LNCNIPKLALTIVLKKLTGKLQMRIEFVAAEQRLPSLRRAAALRD
jgi:hypothetical protein